MNQTRTNNEEAGAVSRLSGKVALVTGGSRGIGAGIVQRLAREKADVAFTFLKEKEAADSIVKEASADGNRVIAIQANSGNEQELIKAVEKVAKEFGHIDILVSSAGAFLFKPVDEVSDEEFDHMVAVDLKAAFIASRSALKHMGDGGRIVFVSSNIADFGIGDDKHLQHGQSWPRRSREGNGPRSWAAGNHSKHRSPRSDQNRREPRRQSLCQGSSVIHGDASIWRTGRCCCDGCFSC